MFAARAVRDGTFQTDLSIPSMHCAACMSTIEAGLASLENVRLGTGQSFDETGLGQLGGRCSCHRVRRSGLGYPAHLTDDPVIEKDKTLSELIFGRRHRRFATGNIMLLSVSVWSGAEGATRDLFHWVSALIAIPSSSLPGASISARHGTPCSTDA